MIDTKLKEELAEIKAADRKIVQKLISTRVQSGIKQVPSTCLPKIELAFTLFMTAAQLMDRCLPKLAAAAAELKDLERMLLPMHKVVMEETVLPSTLKEQVQLTVAVVVEV
jgi:hypothetical protein